MQTAITAARGTAREKDLWNRIVNDNFGGSQPILSGQESIAAAKRLYRRAMGKPFDGTVKLTSGNRYTWVKRGVMSVNPDKQELHTRGLRALIHDLSHYCHQRLHPKDAPHSARQAYLERDLAQYAIEQGFLEGKLKSKAEPAEKADPVKQRYQAMVRRRDKWAAELERAKRLHAKAVLEVKTYERRHGDRLK